jgi:cell division septation protein DedD
MPHYSAEQLVINAVRCALSSGDYMMADNYLASRVKNSQDPTILAYIRLYTLWSRLSQAKTGKDLAEPMNLLRSCAKDPSMEAVRPAVLLSIWYIDGDQESARLLISQYPQSPETAIVQGKVTLLPAPFWYFSPRNTLAEPGVPDTSPLSAPAPEVQPPSDSTVKISPPSSPERPSASVERVSPGVYQQLGIFRNEAYARRLLDEATAKGFSPILRTAIRSGGTFFVVLVAENANRTMRDRLNAAGFECILVNE